MQNIRETGQSNQSQAYLGTIVSVRRLLTMKQSNFPGLCSSCLQVSFNTWPSALGTRNENLESLVLFLVPCRYLFTTLSLRHADYDIANMEDVLRFAPPDMPRMRSWRILPTNDRKEYDFSTLVFQDRWTLSKQQAESTRLFGEDYAELANIAQLYQRSLPRPVCYLILLSVDLCQQR